MALAGARKRDEASEWSAKGSRLRPIPPSDAPLIRHSARHDWYRNPKTGVAQPVPRHREIKEFLAAHILKKLVG
jgi:hypothetical protein